MIVYVLINRCIVSVLAHRAIKMHIGPKITSPQLLLHLWAALEDFSCSYAFEHRHNFHYDVSGHRLHKKMDVVLVRTYFPKIDLIGVVCTNTVSLPTMHLSSASPCA